MSAPEALQLALRFQEARVLGGHEGRAALVALLQPHARYMVLGKDVNGADAVADELLAGGNGALARRLDWLAPQPAGARVRLDGRRRAGSRDRGLIVTLSFADGAVALVQEQRTVAPPAEPQAIVLPEALRRRIDNALAERRPMMVAHADAQGQPILSFRGSVQVHSQDQLALWIRNSEGGFVQAIRANPRIALMYRDEDAKATYQFQGRARVATAPEERQHIFERAHPVERAHDFAMLGAAVVVDLDRVEGYSGLGPQGQVDPIRLLRDGAAA